MSFGYPRRQGPQRPYRTVARGDTVGPARARVSRFPDDPEGQGAGS